MNRTTSALVRFSIAALAGGAALMWNGQLPLDSQSSLVSSAEAVLAECDSTVDDVDVYVPHQANVRIIDHATRKLGIDPDQILYTPQGRPTHLVSDPTPIHELMS